MTDYCREKPKEFNSNGTITIAPPTNTSNLMTRLELRRGSAVSVVKDFENEFNEIENEINRLYDSTAKNIN